MEQVSLSKNGRVISVALVEEFREGLVGRTTVNIDHLLTNLFLTLSANSPSLMHNAQAREDRLFSRTELSLMQLENRQSIEQCGDGNQQFLKRLGGLEHLLLPKTQVFNVSIFQMRSFSRQLDSTFLVVVVRLDLREVALGMGVLPPPKMLLPPSGDDGGTEGATGTASRVGGGASAGSKDAAEQLSLWWLVALFGIGAVAIWAYRHES